MTARARRGVLFDLFGTLIEVDYDRLPTVAVGGEERPSTYPRWAALLESYVGPRTAAEVYETFRRAAGPASNPTVERPSRHRFRGLLEGLECADDVIEEAAVVLSRAHLGVIVEATRLPAAHRAVLDAARRVGGVAIVSNFDDSSTAYAILARHGLLEKVDAIVVSEAVGRRKPHPLPVVAALRSLDVAAGDAVFIGDGEVADVGAARAAGVPVVLIAPTAATQAAATGVIVVARLGDVPSALGW